MSERLSNIKEIELDLFGRIHNRQQDATFVYINNYLTDVYFGDKGYEWNESKVKEEYGEINDALTQLEREIQESSITSESLHHLVEEIGDWILSASTMLTYEECDRQLYNSHLNEILGIIERVNFRLCPAFGEDVITVDKVFESNKTKLEEYASAYKTYEEVQKDEVITNNPLARIIRMLYTKNDLRNPANKDKIIKELRRMRFAIIEYQNWGRGL